MKVLGPDPKSQETGLLNPDMVLEAISKLLWKLREISKGKLTTGTREFFATIANRETANKNIGRNNQPVLKRFFRAMAKIRITADSNIKIIQDA